MDKNRNSELWTSWVSLALPAVSYLFFGIPVPWTAYLHVIRNWEHAKWIFIIHAISAAVGFSILYLELPLFKV